MNTTLSLFDLKWPKHSTHYSILSGSFYRQDKGLVYAWEPKSKTWTLTTLPTDTLTTHEARPVLAEFIREYKDQLISEVRIAVEMGCGPTGFPFGTKGISDRFDMIRVALRGYQLRLRALSEKPRYAANEKVRVKLNTHVKKTQLVWIDGVSTIGGYCRATGNKIESGENLYYVRSTAAPATRPLLYTYCEEALESILEPMPKPPKVISVPDANS